MGAAAATLILSGLEKRYGRHQALAGLDLEIGKGQCLALLGPNGAGKTTTCEIVAGLINPDAGTVRVCGHTQIPANRKAIAARIGILNQETVIYRKYTVQEVLELFASLYPQPSSLPQIMAQFDLLDCAGKRLESLSGGQLQRVYFACSLVNDPELLLLDEPTSGLDPAIRQSLWAFLKDLKSRREKSILLTTHDMDEAEELADQVAVIHQGRVIERGTPQELIGRHCDGYTMKVGVPTGNRERLLEEFGRLNAGGDMAVTTDARFVSFHGKDILHVFKRLESMFTRHDVGTGDIQIRRSTLEDVFIKLTGRGLGEVTR